MSLPKKVFRPSSFKRFLGKKLSLSSYFPDGVQFFYGYPTGEDSGFLNKVKAYTEELVAARTFCCCGSNIVPVGFISTIPSAENKWVYDVLEVPTSKSINYKLIKTPAEITGHDRNVAVKEELKNIIDTGKFIMAQPYLDKSMEHLYLIPPELTVWLNDKKNMDQFISAEYLPRRLGVYSNGIELYEKLLTVKLPVVIKASSSSSGDGVYLCTEESDVLNAKEKLKTIKTSIIVEQYINTNKNYALHFGIPYDKNKPVNLIGVNEQLVTEHGEFMGAIIRSHEIPNELQTAAEHLISEVLPKVREMGWYGVGGIDILIEEDGGAYFIDCNFRMTGMTAYHFLLANDKVDTPLVSFSAEFEGDIELLVKTLKPYINTNNYTGNKLNIVSLSKNYSVWRLNAAFSFKDINMLRKSINELLSIGVKSGTLQRLLNQDIVV